MLADCFSNTIVNVRYPFGRFGFICAFTLIGAQGILAPRSYLDWALYFGCYGLFLRGTYTRLSAKSFWIPQLCSLGIAAWMIHTCTHLPKHGCYQRGVFQFEKLFRTQPGRVGGFGTLTLANRTTIPLYVHAPSTEAIVWKDTQPYRFSGYIQPLRNPFRSSQNFSFYLWSRFLRWHTTRVSLSPVPASSPPNWLQRCRQSLFTALTTKEDRLSRIYRAILMGKKEELTKRQIEHFFYTGTMHLFAVSGLHVGIVSTFFFFVGRLLCLPACFRWLLTCGGVFLYASMVGFSPSTVRASLMVGFVLLAQLFSRPINGRNAFFNTIGLTLACNPFALWDVGFQLSYGTVASILCIGIPLSQWYARCQKQPVSPWRLTLIVSFAASLMSSLFSIYYWNLFSPWSFLANLFLIPFASGIVVLGMISWLISLFAPPLFPVIEWLSRISLSFLLNSVEMLERLPGAMVHVSMPPRVFGFCLFVFAWLIAQPGRREEKLVVFSKNN